MLRGLKEANPLLIDYVKSDSRGKAAGFKVFGVFTGEIFCQAVLIGFTAKMSFQQSFHIVSFVLLAMSVPLYFMVDDTHEVERLEEEVAHSSMWEKVKEITGLVYDECKA